MLNFIIWVILIYFAFLLFWRYVLPFILKRYMRKMQQKFTQYNNQGFANQTQKHEGEVIIENIPEAPEKEKKPDDENDYVDFEEIKNNKTDPS